MKKISLLFLLLVLSAAMPLRLHAGDRRDPFAELKYLRKEREEQIGRIEKIKRGEGCPPLVPEFIKRAKIRKIQAVIGGMTERIRTLKNEIDGYKYEIVEIRISYERGDVLEINAPIPEIKSVGVGGGQTNIRIPSSALPAKIVGSRTMKVLVSGTKVNKIFDSDLVILNVNNVDRDFRHLMKFRKNRGVSISVEDYQKPMVGRGEWVMIGTFDLEPEDINWLAATMEGHWGRYKYTVKLKKCD